MCTRKDDAAAPALNDGLSFERSPADALVFRQDHPATPPNYRKHASSVVASSKPDSTKNGPSHLLSQPLRYDFGTQASGPEERSGSSGRRTHLPAQGAFHDGLAMRKIVRQSSKESPAAEPLSQGLGRHRGSGNDRTPEGPAGSISMCLGSSTWPAQG